MNAIECVKKNRIEKERIHLEKMKAENWHNGFYNDLKQIVDAWELVESYGGLKEAKKYSSYIADVSWTIHKKIEKAINLVERCQ